MFPFSVISCSQGWKVKRFFRVVPMGTCVPSGKGGRDASLVKNIHGFPFFSSG